MTYYDPRLMAPHKHDALIAYLQGEGLDPRDICAERFSIHNGWISGYFLVRDADGKPCTSGQDAVKRHFTQRQVHPVPDELL